MYARRFILRTGRTTPMLLRSIYIGDGARITKKRKKKESVKSHLIRTLPKAKKKKKEKNKEQSTRRITYLKICPVAAFC